MIKYENKKMVISKSVAKRIATQRGDKWDCLDDYIKELKAEISKGVGKLQKKDRSKSKKTLKS